MATPKYAPHTSTAAIKRANAKVGTVYATGMCQRFSREIFGIPATGDYDGDGDADAVDAWKKAVEHGKVVTGVSPSKVPAGVIAYWSGGSKGHGHAAPTVATGVVVSTDRPTAGEVGRVTAASIGPAWGMKFLGYVVVDGNGYTLTDPPPLRAEVVAMTWNLATEATKVQQASQPSRFPIQVDAILTSPATVFGFQETGGPSFLTALRLALSPSVALVKASGRWRAVGYRTDVWEEVRSWLATLNKAGTKHHVMAELRHKETGVHIFTSSAHLTAGATKAKARAAETKNWIGDIARLNTKGLPVVLMADTNSTTKVNRQLIAAGYKNARLDVYGDGHKWKSMNAFKTTKKGHQIDGIWLSRGNTSRKAWRLVRNHVASDHNRVIATFTATTKEQS